MIGFGSVTILMCCCAWRFWRKEDAEVRAKEGILIKKDSTFNSTVLSSPSVMVIPDPKILSEKVTPVDQAEAVKIEAPHRDSDEVHLIKVGVYGQTLTKNEPSL